MTPRRIDLDLGDDHGLQFFGWAPDRTLNPQYEGIPDVERAGAIVWHIDQRTGEEHAGSVQFDTAAPLSGPKWTVESWEPLTISPSVLCSCGDHGFIREGRWVRA
jgi:hypothetical protein